MTVPGSCFVVDGVLLLWNACSNGRDDPAAASSSAAILEGTATVTGLALVGSPFDVGVAGLDPRPDGRVEVESLSDLRSLTLEGVVGVFPGSPRDSVDPLLPLHTEGPGGASG